MVHTISEWCMLEVASGGVYGSGVEALGCVNKRMMQYGHDGVQLMPLAMPAD